MNKLLRAFEKGFLLAGLRANPVKSASIQIVISGKCKSAVSGIEPFACINRELVSILDPRRNYKYLGLNSLVDKEPNAFKKIQDRCEQITKASCSRNRGYISFRGGELPKSLLKKLDKWYRRSVRV